MVSMKSKRRWKGWFRWGFENLLIVGGGYFLLFTGGGVNADESCSTSDGLSINISSNGAVNNVSIGGNALPTLAAPGGFTLRELRPNLVPNPGLTASDNITSDNWIYIQKAGDVTYDNDEGHITPGCVKIYVPGSASMESGYARTGDIDAVPGATYRFSAWGKASGVGGGNPAVRVFMYDSNDLYVEQVKLDFSQNSDWEKKSRVFIAGANVAKFRVLANIFSGYGTFWVDDVYLNFTADANQVLNPGFDAVTGDMPTDWARSLSGVGTVEYRGNEGHAADGCVIIDVPSPNNATTKYLKSANYIKAIPGATYSFSAWGKGSGCNPTGNHPAVRLYEYDSNNNYLRQKIMSFDLDEENKFNWTLKSKSFVAEADVAKFLVVASIYESYGTFWVDDIKLTCTGDAIYTIGEANLSLNPSFDNVTGDWSDNWSRSSSQTGTVTYEPTGGHTGGCVTINTGGSTYVNSNYPISAEYIDAEPNTQYRISAWGKATEVYGALKPGGGTYAPCVMVREYDGNNNWLGNTSLEFSQDVADWEKKNMVFTTRPNTAKLKVMALLYQSYGTFRVDDVMLSKFSQDKISLDGPLVANGDGSFTQSATVSDIEFQLDYIPHDRYIEVRGNINDLTGEDRAIVVEYGLPVNASGWNWTDYITGVRQIAANTRYDRTFLIGDSRKQNLYPFSCVEDGNKGLGLAVPMDEPRIYRTGYNTGEGYTIGYDFGLAKGTNKIGDSHADFKFIIYKLDEPEWGFRAMAKKYYELYPEFFIRRNEREGLLYPTAVNPADFPGISDFGFAFDFARYLRPDKRADDWQFGLYPVTYTEPWGCWRSFGNNSTEPSYDDKITALTGDLNSSEIWWDVITMSNMANVVFNAAPYDENGNMYLDHPGLWHLWATGYSLEYPTNPDPEIGAADPESEALEYDVRLAMSYAKYNHSNTPSENPCMGFHLDSVEGNWAWAEIENYRRDHWDWADFPLVFSYKTKQPVLLGSMSQYDGIQYLNGKMHAEDKLITANTFTSGYALYGNLIDAMGGEVWATKMHETEGYLRRILSYHKTNRNMLQWINYGTGVISEAETETYINDQMFYGMFPSINIGGLTAEGANIRYWDESDLYDRDRHLFKKYMPVIKEISANGWEPIPYAVASNSNIKVERFGRGYFTVAAKSSSTTTQTGNVTIDLAKCGFNVGSFTSVSAVELCSGNTTNLTITNNQVTLPVTVDPNTTLVYRLGLDQVGSWGLDEIIVNETTVTVTDSSGYDNTGNLVNMNPATCLVNGITGKALLFNGSGYVKLEDPASLTIRNNISVEAWFKTNSQNDRQVIYARGEAISIEYTSSMIKFYVRNAAGSMKTLTAYSLGDMEWHHVVGSYSDSMVRLYVDGELRASDTLGGAIRDINDDKPNTIGCKFAWHTGDIYDYDYYFNGIIDEVRIYNRVLTEDQVRGHYLECVKGNWYFDETAGATTAVDSSGYGNNGTLVGMDPQTCHVPGRIGNALVFDGSDDYVLCGNNSSLNFTAAITVEAWVNTESYGWQGIISKWTGGKSYALAIWGDTGKAIFFLSYDGTNYYTVAGTTLLVNTGWHHLVGTYDGNWMRLYVDGEEEGTPVNQAFNISVSTGNLTIGSWDFNSKRFNGTIDEAKVYSRALSADEVSAHYVEGGGE